MSIKRRGFVKGCGVVAASFLLLPVGAIAAKVEKAAKPPASAAQSRIEKSIKANFGGGFSLRSHRQSGGLTRAEIEHLGNQYSVTSANLLDWKIVRSALIN